MRIALALVLVPSLVRAEPDARLVVRDAMVAELERSMARLKLKGFEAPYFVAYTVREYDTVDVQAKNGALLGNTRTRSRQAYVEIHEPQPEAPIDDDPAALRATLWLLTDTRYKAALSTLNQRRGVRATTVVE